MVLLVCLICIRVCLYAGTHACAIMLTYVLRHTAFRFPQGSARARAWTCDGGTSGRTGPGPRQALWRAAAKSISGEHICKYIGIYVYTTSGGRSRGKTISSLRKRFGTRRRNPLPDYLYVYINIYMYTHISGNSVM